MFILNLNTKKAIEDVTNDFYDKDNSYIILCDPHNLDFFKDVLDIDEMTYMDSLRYDDITKLHQYDNYDYLSLNTFQIKEKRTIIEEVSIYLADNYILTIVSEDNFLYTFIKNIINQTYTLEDEPKVALFQANYFIFKEIIVNSFESLETIEDIVLQIEDDLTSDSSGKTSGSPSERISYVRGLARNMVKTVRPLLYIGDRVVSENVRYTKYPEVKAYIKDEIEGIDLGVDRLYNFAMSTRELSDKLLDIYSSKVGEKTNSLITKLTLLTAISAPLTIITGIYGMNFKNMPELSWLFGYPLILSVMLGIIIIGIVIFKIKKLL